MEATCEEMPYTSDAPIPAALSSPLVPRAPLQVEPAGMRSNASGSVVELRTPAIFAGERQTNVLFHLRGPESGLVLPVGQRCDCVLLASSTHTTLAALALHSCEPVRSRGGSVPPPPLPGGLRELVRLARDGRGPRRAAFVGAGVSSSFVTLFPLLAPLLDTATASQEQTHVVYACLFDMLGPSPSTLPCFSWLLRIFRSACADRNPARLRPHPTAAW